MTATATALASVTIDQALDAHLLDLADRKRRPAKPSTLATFRSYRNWIAHVGRVPVQDFNNARMRDFIAYLSGEGLSAKTVAEVSGLVKSAIASVVDPTTGEQVHSRAWNTKFLDVPEVKNQRQPTVTATELENAIAAAFETGHMLDGVLWALAAGSGARIGELRALRVGPSEVSSCWNPEDSLLTIRTSMWRGFEQAPKTEAAHRTIEIAGNLNELLKSFVASRSAKPGDFLFASSTGRATDVTTLRSRLDEYLPGRGFHAMRRFYITHKRQCGMSEQVLKALVGHASSDITDRYSRITSERRRAEVERCGLGFTLPVHSA